MKYLKSLNGRGILASQQNALQFHLRRWFKCSELTRRGVLAKQILVHYFNLLAINSVTHTRVYFLGDDSIHFPDNICRRIYTFNGYMRIWIACTNEYWRPGKISAI